MNDSVTSNISEAPCTSTSSSICSASSTPSYPPVYVNTQGIHPVNEGNIISTSYVQNIPPPVYQYPSVNSPQYCHQGPTPQQQQNQTFSQIPSTIHDYRSHIDRWQYNQMPLRDSGVHSSTSQSEIYSNPSYSQSYLTTTCNSPFETSSYISGFSNEELSTEHQTTIENLKSSFTSKDSPQNISQEKAFEEILLMLQDTDDYIVFKAAQAIKYIAKEDSSKERQFTLGTINNIAIIQTLNNIFIKTNLNPKISQEILSTFFYILSYNDGVSLFLKFLQTFPNEQNLMLDTLLLHLSNPEHQRGCHKFSLIILHSLIYCSNPYRTTIINILRDKSAISKILVYNCLEMSTLEEKSMSIMIDIIRKLCENNAKQKEIFINHNGIEQLFVILLNYNYENLTNRGLLLLKAIGNHDPKLLVTKGVFKIFPHLLMSTSSKIRKLSLEGVRDLSDIPNSSLELEGTLKCLMHVLCTPYIEEACLSICAISNLLANNQNNKLFFISNDGLGILRSLLFSTATVPNREPIQRELEEIEERSFATIRNLCINHEKGDEIQNFIMNDEGIINIFLQHLHHPRPAVLRQLLWVLTYLSKNQTKIEVFRKDNFVSGLTNALKVCVTTHSKMDLIEEISVKELISLTLTIICNLIEDPKLRDMFLEIFLMSDNFIEIDNGRMISLPVAVILIKEDKFKKNILQIMANFSKDDRMCGRFTGHPEVIEIIKKIMTNETGICSILADSCYRNWINKSQSGRTFEHVVYDSKNNFNNDRPTIPHHQGTPTMIPQQVSYTTSNFQRMINYQQPSSSTNLDTSFYPVLDMSGEESSSFNNDISFGISNIQQNNEEIFYNNYSQDQNITIDSGLGRTFIDLDDNNTNNIITGNKRQKMDSTFSGHQNYTTQQQPPSEVQLSRQFSEVNISMHPSDIDNIQQQQTTNYNILPVKNTEKNDVKRIDTINDGNNIPNDKKIIGEL
uniref:ARM repeat-containing protein n=1 Tax=Parastrongyloides trichosuri TaxID=131310 RepID=A0A0N4ZIM9_PARTI